MQEIMAKKIGKIINRSTTNIYANVFLFILKYFSSTLIFYNKQWKPGVHIEVRNHEMSINLILLLI